MNVCTVKYMVFGKIDSDADVIVTVFSGDDISFIYAGAFDWDKSYTKMPVGKASMFYRKIDADASMYVVKNIDDIERFRAFFDSRFRRVK